MDAGDVIAIYAALVATGALGWQVYAHRQATRDRVTVEATIAILMPQEGDIEAVMVTVRNDSELPVTVTSAGLDKQDGSGHFVKLFAPYATVPGKVEAKGEGFIYYRLEELSEHHFDLTKPVTAWANLAGRDKRLTAKPKTLRKG